MSYGFLFWAFDIGLVFEVVFLLRWYPVGLRDV